MLICEHASMHGVRMHDCDAACVMHLGMGISLQQLCYMPCTGADIYMMKLYWGYREPSHVVLGL